VSLSIFNLHPLHLNRLPVNFLSFTNKQLELSSTINTLEFVSIALVYKDDKILIKQEIILLFISYLITTS
jgi:hypothetical protein